MTGFALPPSSFTPSNRLTSTILRPLPPRQIPRPTFARTVPRAEVSVVDSVRHALESAFPSEDISRVSTSFVKAVGGHTLDNDPGKPTHQHANSFIEGLDAKPFIDDFSSDYAWVTHLEHNWTQIRDELVTATASSDLATRGNNVWAPPVVAAANAYGPDWRTLVLQDRVWDPQNTQLFPVTTSILQDPAAQVPSVEAFFARQSPETGIKLHTDYCNFILTMHLGLTVPKDKSWIEVGGERRYWQNGKALVFNTSFYHQTMNESTDEDRVVLLLRFWHPELSLAERKALDYLFRIIDDPESHPDVLAARTELELVKKRPRSSKRRHTNRSPTAGKGFGK